MSATLAPYGFHAVRSYFRGPPQIFSLRNGIASGYNTNIGRGDPIKRLTDGTFALAAAGDNISGFFNGWETEDGGVFRSGFYWKAGSTWTAGMRMLYTPAEGHIFKCQCNGSLAMTSIGDVADHVAGTVNANNGLSAAVLSSTLAGAGNSAGFKIVDLVEMPGNAWGDAYTEVLVRVNELSLGEIAGNAV